MNILSLLCKVIRIKCLGPIYLIHYLMGSLFHLFPLFQIRNSFVFFIKCVPRSKYFDAYFVSTDPKGFFPNMSRSYEAVVDM